MSTVNHPDHYGKVPGVECIDVIEWFPCNPANAIKYIWRASLKDSTRVIEDYEKAIWYLQREIARLNSSQEQNYNEIAICECSMTETGEESII